MTDGISDGVCHVPDLDLLARFARHELIERACACCQRSVYLTGPQYDSYASGARRKRCDVLHFLCAECTQAQADKGGRP